MIWTPQAGVQTFAATCPVDIIFFGGTRGGGKSDTILGRQLIGAERYGADWNGMVIRKKFKDFRELRRRIDGMIRKGLPATRKGGDNQTNTIEFKNGAQFILAAIGHIEIAEDFVGHQYTEIGIDEAPNLPFIGSLLDKLKGSLRSPAGVPTQMFLTGNPGGPGASQIKLMFMEDGRGNKKIPGRIYRTKVGEGWETSVFIKSTLDDNQILCKNDPKYVNNLRAIKDPLLRRAWLEGDWDVFIGQAFDFFPEIHIVKDPVWPIPDYAPIYCTFDWGFGKPFSVGWWWIDSDNRAYRFNEWYGWNGEIPDVGMRLTDSRIAQGIVERELKMGLRDPEIKNEHGVPVHKKAREVVYIADPTCHNKKPDYMGGGQGPSTYEEFKPFEIMLKKGDPSRSLKIRQFRERLAVPADGTLPMMMVYPQCTQFVRTIPSLCLDDYNPEDVDTDQEDHIYDEAALLCMARPLKFDVEAVQAEVKRQQEEQKINELDNMSKAAWIEHRGIMEQFDRENEEDNEAIEEYFDSMLIDSGFYN